MGQRVRLRRPAVALAPTVLQRHLQRLKLHGEHIVLSRLLACCITLNSRLLQHGLEVASPPFLRIEKLLSPSLLGLELGGECIAIGRSLALSVALLAQL